MIKYKEKAHNSFFKREYEKALFNYALALKEVPKDNEARIGAMLSDMAFEKEDEAIALFEYYEATKSLDKENADAMIEQIIESVDQSNDYIFDLLDNIEDHIALMEDGIEYQDFLQLINRSESFKKALEDIMFSTKIIIHKKEDFIDFVNLLLEHDYKDLALNYIESALLYYPSELFFQTKLKQLEQKQH
ncbi:MAG: tetratricopeptide repeat protein [Epsilonproteobacteria bacterium]|nr:tetratricopeptide repeat protein [Campylobacterota bacterium]